MNLQSWRFCSFCTLFTNPYFGGLGLCGWMNKKMVVDENLEDDKKMTLQIAALSTGDRPLQPAVPQWPSAGLPLYRRWSAGHW